jgi:DNA-binding transcriptional ArsR family regulator
MSQRRRRVRKKNRDEQGRGLGPEALVKALNHPVRVKALSILSDRMASPNEIADQIEVPLSNVSYHVRVLDELGLIEVVEEERVRGSVAHFYRAVKRVLNDNSHWSGLDPKVRSAISGSLIESFISDAARSLAAGVFERREERHASRTPLLLDEKGWRRVLEIQAKANEGVLREQAAAEIRMSDSCADGIHAIVGMFCFEVLPDVTG